MAGNSALSWRTSSYSGGSGGQCVQVAVPGSVLVRDSKNSDGGYLRFSARAWREFAARIKGGNAG
jgi:hypothetical protein